MFDDLLNIKAFDKKYNWKESLADLYTRLTSEFEKTSAFNEKTTTLFRNASNSKVELEDKDAVEAIVKYWVFILIYICRVNFLINIVDTEKELKRIKDKERKEFISISENHIMNQIDHYLSYSHSQLFYFYFKFIDVRNEINLVEKISAIYLNAFKSAVRAVDKESLKAASKIVNKYDLEELVKYKCNELIEKFYSWETED